MSEKATAAYQYNYNAVIINSICVCPLLCREQRRVLRVWGVSDQGVVCLHLLDYGGLVLLWRHELYLALCTSFLQCCGLIVCTALVPSASRITLCSADIQSSPQCLQRRQTRGAAHRHLPHIGMNTHEYVHSHGARAHHPMMLNDERFPRLLCGKLIELRIVTKHPHILSRQSRRHTHRDALNITLQSHLTLAHQPAVYTHPKFPRDSPKPDPIRWAPRVRWPPWPPRWARRTCRRGWVTGPHTAKPTPSTTV